MILQVSFPIRRDRNNFAFNLSHEMVFELINQFRLWSFWPRWYVEPRREQVRLQEELVMKKKSLRGTEIRNMNEMGEMKRAQETRVDDFSVQKLRESHETIHKLTSQLQEMQEQINSMSDSGHDKKWNQIIVEKCSHVPSQPERIPSPRSMLRYACNLKHGIHLDYWKTFLQIHVRRSSHCKYLIKELIHLWHQMLQVRLPRLSAQGDLWQERKKE